MGEFETQEAAADFLQELARLVEFEEPVVGAAMKDEDMTLAVGRHRYRFAQVFARGQLQKIRRRCEWNFRNILNGRLALRKRRRDGQQYQTGRRYQDSFHRSLLENL